MKIQMLTAEGNIWCFSLFFSCQWRTKWQKNPSLPPIALYYKILSNKFDFHSLIVKQHHMLDTSALKCQEDWIYFATICVFMQCVSLFHNIMQSGMGWEVLGLIPRPGEGCRQAQRHSSSERQRGCIWRHRCPVTVFRNWLNRAYCASLCNNKQATSSKLAVLSVCMESCLRLWS